MRRRADSWESRINVVSVISRINDVGSRPDSSRAAWISSTSVPVSNCRGETLTDTAVGNPASCHWRVWRHASRSTKAPTSTMSPDSSRAGMKASGATTSPDGRRHRSKRLHALDGAVAQLDHGLVDEEELARFERQAQVPFELDPGAELAAHVGLEAHGPVPARRLGFVERDVGVHQQVLGRGVGARDDADAGRRW